MKSSRKNKMTKGAIFSISALVGIGTICVGTGCYFELVKPEPNISNNNTTDSNVSGNDNKPSTPQQDQNKPNVSPEDNKPVNPPAENPELTPPVTPQPSVPEKPTTPPTKPETNPSEPSTPITPPDQNNNGSTTPDNNQNNEAQPPVVPPSVPTPPPAKPEVPGPKMQFTVDITRSSGFKFSEIISFDVFDANTGVKLLSAIDDFEDEHDGIVKFELPENGRYKIKLAEFNGAPSLKRTKYNYPEEIIFDKNTPNIRYEFEPIIEDYEEGKKFKLDDVARELWVTEDVLGQPISLRKNAREGKMTVLMHMRTGCQNSIATMTALFKSIYHPSYSDDISVMNQEIKNHVEVICFTNSSEDSLSYLRNFAETRWPEFHFVKDDDSKFFNAYFPNNEGYPKTAILDWQGVVVHKFDRGKVSNQTAFESYIPKFSKAGVK